MTQWHPGLYVVATPIGNLGDLSARALEAFQVAAIVAAEDTRTSGTLVRRSGSSAKLVSLTEHNVEQRIPELIPAARDRVVVLVSDAGTPAVADPGARLVAAAHKAGVSVFTIPGPSALTAAVSVAGFDTPPYVFLGFLPRPKGERARALSRAAPDGGVIIFFESPARLSATLSEVAELFGDPEAVVCRELTKLHEESVRGPASELAVRFASAKGECTVLVQVPRPDGSAAAGELIAAMHRAGARRSAAAAEVARLTGLTREQAYDLWPSDG
jgi:16S rRNA (cytidine1402-2'-O)-methyltransferase